MDRHLCWRKPVSLLILVAIAAALAGCGGRRSEQYAEQGNAYLRLGRTDEAEQMFRDALEADPANAQAQLGMARVLAAKGQAGQALDAYRKALELDPQLGAAYGEAARLAMRSEGVGLERALEFADRYSEADPVQGGILKAQVLESTEEPAKRAEALGVLTDLREAYPDSVPVRVHLANAYLARGKTAEAENELQTALSEIDPNSMMARMALVDVYRTEGKLDEMVTELRELSVQHPEEPSLKLALAQSLLAAGEAEEAEAIAEPVFEAAPDSPWANYVMGSCFLALEDYAKAAQCLEIAARALPHHRAVMEKYETARRGGQAAEPSGAVQQAVSAEEAVAKPDDWRSLWESGQLVQLVRNREALAAGAGEGFDEHVTLAAAFTGDMELAQELAGRLPESSQVRRLLEALAAQDAAELKVLFEDWNESGPERKLMQLNAQGFALSAIGARGQALRVLSEALALDPRNGAALWNLARMYETAGMTRFSARTLQRLVATHEGNLNARYLLFGALRRAGMSADARQSAEATYALYPDELQALLNLALIYRETGDEDLAVDVIRRGRERLSEDERLAIALGEALLQANKPAAALEAVADSDLSGQLAGAQATIRGFAHAALGDWGKALEACEQVSGEAGRPVKLLHAACLLKAGRQNDAAALATAVSTEGAPGDLAPVVIQALGGEAQLSGAPAELAGKLGGNPEALAQFAYGLACQSSGLNGSAMQAFSRLDELVPSDPIVIALAMESLARARNVGDRAEKAQEFVEEHPDMPGAWLGLASVYFSMGEADKERAALDKALEAAPEDPRVVQHRAMFFERQQEPEAAVAAYRRLLGLVPDNGPALNNLAYALLRTSDDPQEAVRIAQRAKEVLGNDAAVLHTLGLAQLEAGQLDDAQQNLARAREMRPGDPTMLLDYGRLLIAKGQKEEGVRNVESALRNADVLGLDFPRRAEAEALLKENE